MSGVGPIGNAAKRYCLAWIEERLPADGSCRVLDLGCGDGSQFVEFLGTHPQVTYVGVELDPAAAAAARRRLGGYGAEIIARPAYGLGRVLDAKFDVVVSFSALEHVYRREDYLRSAHDCLAEGGHVLINYDAGHFRHPMRRDRIKNLASGLLGRVGAERFYQRLVKEAEFVDLVGRVGLEVVESKSFNTYSLKQWSKLVPEDRAQEFAERWLELELWMNEREPNWGDALTDVFGTRNHILRHA